MILSRQLIADIVTDSETFRHVLNTRELDNAIIGYMGEVVSSGMSQEQMRRDPKMMMALCSIYDQSIESVSGYEMEDGSPVDMLLVPALHKIEVIGRLSKDRVTLPKNSPRPLDS